MTETIYHYKRLVILRLLTANVFILLLQLMGMKFCVFSSSTLPVDFAAGTAAAFIFMRGYSILPGIWLGSMLAGLMSHLSCFSSFIVASAYTAQTALFFWLCLHYVSPSLIFLKKSIFTHFALLCLAIPLLFSPVISPWQSNSAGLLIITLAITYWDCYFPEIAQWRTIPNFLLLISLFFIALFINLFAIFNNPLNIISLFLYLIAVLLIFSGIRQPNMK